MSISTFLVPNFSLVEVILVLGPICHKKKKLTPSPTTFTLGGYFGPLPSFHQTCNLSWRVRDELLITVGMSCKIEKKKESGAKKPGQVNNLYYWFVHLKVNCCYKTASIG